MWYELWDGETGNRVGKFNTREEALRSVEEDVRRYGRESDAVLSLALVYRNSEDTKDQPLVLGKDLIDLALAAIVADTAPAKPRLRRR